MMRPSFPQRYALTTLPVFDTSPVPLVVVFVLHALEHTLLHTCVGFLLVIGAAFILKLSLNEMLSVPEAIVRVPVVPVPPPQRVAPHRQPSPLMPPQPRQPAPSVPP